METKTAFFASAASGYLVLSLFIWSQQGFMTTVLSLEGGLGVSLMLLMALGACLRRMVFHWALLAVWSSLFLAQQLLQGAMVR